MTSSNPAAVKLCPYKFMAINPRMRNIFYPTLNQYSDSAIIKRARTDHAKPIINKV